MKKFYFRSSTSVDIGIDVIKHSESGLTSPNRDIDMMIPQFISIHQSKKQL